MPDDFADQLRRFNRERAKMLHGRIPDPDERLPVPFTYVGGDVPGNFGMAEEDDETPVHLR